MNRILEFCVGLLCAVWSSYAYFILYPYLWMGKYVENAVGVCKTNFSSDFCEIYAHVLVWLAGLPIDVVSLLTFSLLILGVHSLFSGRLLGVLFVLAGYTVYFVLSVLLSEYDGFAVLPVRLLSTLGENLLIIYSSFMLFRCLTKPSKTAH